MRFANVILSPETQYVLGRNPQGTDLVRLNRLLLRDAYPAELSMDFYPSLNQWFHIAYNFDAASHMQALYVNGALVDASFVNKTIAYDNHALLIAADDDNGTPASFYQGNLDEMTLYPRALTGTEIQGIYTQDGGGKCRTPGTLSIGDLASGATWTLTLVAVPTTCAPVTATVTASSGAPLDPNPANNTATTVPVLVQDVDPSQMCLTIQRVSLNNTSAEICWPLTCAPWTLQATGSLNPPIPWLPITVPVQQIGSRNCTVVPAGTGLQYYRLQSP